MTIQINSEQEQVIGRAIQAGLVETAEQAVEIGVGTIRERLEGSPKPPAPPARNLVELFANSPFAGLDMDFECDRETGREVKL